MLNEIELAKAGNKVRRNQTITEARYRLREIFRIIFNEVLEDELTHDEILALAEFELDGVYEELANIGEPFHGENIEDDPLGRSVELPE